MQREVAARTDLLDCRTHAKTLGPAAPDPDARGAPRARLPPDPRDAARLADPAFRDAVAEGIAAAVVRFFAPVPAEVVLEAPPVPSPA